MTYSRLLTPRSMAVLSIISLGGGYFTLRSRTLAEKQTVRSSRDFAVSVDRSGRSRHTLIDTLQC
ncbi:hypothetical protein COCMIDRAFT_102105 [Bipolaris oryzae ATCC 44560]|uniref:Uncharacterized protein n=1 Tax=Bipolaris oryzae ATCC 44560 TaxID=930090 RepID=W6YZG9_COCMI|nr:uncharacterized protein COCMIDRAFT_102105 [Bipolaris oryzae ATCC 44560]EUC42988.1 hypothetical protein COCMIDRAFT_102105 [Bipolaris oryzae ATCC 44560]